jgi:2-methylcitrate dehydratase PrpD
VGSADAAACDRPEPTDPESAKFSYQHILAAALLDPKVDLETFSNRKISEPSLRAFQPKVHVISYPEWGAGTQAGIARITVRLNDGRTLAREIDQPLGSKKYPLGVEQCWDLYRQYTHGILEEEDVERTMTIILNLEYAENLEEISRILAV